MTREYFRQVPNFEYVDRNYQNKYINNYVTVKNLFKRVKIRDEIFQNLNFFERYSIIGDERPDNVANKIYNNPNLDWLILLCNNILNVYEEWPLSNENFERVMLEKYGSYENLNAIHHYETEEVRDSLGAIIMPAGTIVANKIIDYRKYLVDENGNYTNNPDYQNLVPYFVEFYDPGFEKDVLVSDITNSVSNLEIEQKNENIKRFIYVLKPRYINIVFDDIDKIMKYKKGGTQFLSDTLKRADNIRIYN